MTEKRYFEWNGHRREIGSPHLTDYEIACQVRMLMRDQLNHELVCMDGRDRIICLIAEKDALKHDIERHLKITSEQATENERLVSERDAALARLAELEALINTPETNDFLKAIPLEAAHQIERWGADNDAGKTPMDWFWLIGYLATKVTTSLQSGDLKKARHHCISTSAAMLNWHKQITLSPKEGG